MEKYIHFYRGTWWLWVGFVLLIGVLSIQLSPYMLFSIPFVIGISIYFAFMRGDEFVPDDGEPENHEIESTSLPSGVSHSSDD
jgi:hypothetical protein